MGAIGPAIFSDDVACDVRDAYKRHIADGRTGVEATDTLIDEWLKGLRDDDDDVMVFWLALAATQSRLGRLEDRVRDRAIAIIDGGEDLVRWREVGQEDKRAAVLTKLREQLLGPQPAPKNVRVERTYNPPCKAGDFLALRLKSGRRIIWQVLAVDDDRGLECVALDFVGDELPDLSTLSTLPLREHLPTSRVLQFSVVTFKKRALPVDRLEVLSLNAAPRRRVTHLSSHCLFFWESIDIEMKHNFGWE